MQIRFTLDPPLLTTIRIVDFLGNTIRTIDEKLLEEGERLYTIDLMDVSAGEYYLQIRTDSKLFNAKVVASY